MSVSSDAMLAAMRAQFENHAAFHAGAQLAAQGHDINTSSFEGVSSFPHGLTATGMGQQELQSNAVPQHQQQQKQKPIASLILPSERQYLLNQQSAAASTAQFAVGPAAPALKPAEEAAEEEEPDVQKCPLHKKMNKACKFCKAYAQWVQRQEKKREDMKNATRENLKENTQLQTYADHEKPPIPNFQSFPRLLAERIQKTDIYIKARQTFKLSDVMDALTKCDTCDTLNKNKATLKVEPSPYLCIVYHLLSLQMTEGDLVWMMTHDSCWIRCAAFLYARLGFQCDRYWDCLGENLMDDEEFVAFTTKGGEPIPTSVGDYVENLLMKGDYGEIEKLPLPRIPVATRTKICKRVSLHPQYRKRYEANLEVIDRFNEAGIDVEVCNVDGEWRRAVTHSSSTPGSRCVSVMVAYPNGVQENISIGRLIVPSSSSPSSDLTRHRGKDAQALFDRYDEQQKESALAKGTNYCKPSIQTLCVRGVRFKTGDKRSKADMPSEWDLETAEEERLKARKKEQEHVEKQAKLAAIESKYCAKAPAQDSAPIADRMRLG